MQFSSGNIPSGSLYINKNMGVSKITIKANGGTISIQGMYNFLLQDQVTLFVSGPVTLEEGEIFTAEASASTNPLDGLLLTCGTGTIDFIMGWGGS